MDFLFVAVPYDIDVKTISIYSRVFGEFSEAEGIPPNMDSNELNFVKSFDRYGEQSGSLRVQLQSTLSENPKRFRTELNEPLSFHTPKIKKGVEYQEGAICFSNMSKEWIKIIYDVIAVAVEYEEDDDDDEHMQRLTRKIIQKDSHITPVEKEIQKIIKKGKSIKREMDMMDKMEKRMRKTADGTNKRVRVFNYLSILLLLLTSLFQMVYLKNFFQKKKVI